MATRNKQQDEQPVFWIPTSSSARSPGHPFDQRLNTILREAEFDRFVESRCECFYAKNGRPSLVTRGLRSARWSATSSRSCWSMPRFEPMPSSSMSR